MDLKQLEYIAAIAEERSISKAAKRFFLSPSALSQYLKRLEETEHLPPLFYRHNKEFLLTDAGRIYVNGALTILSLSKKLEHSRPQTVPAIRLAVPGFLEPSVLIHCASLFASAFPGVLLRLHSMDAGPARQGLLEERLDAAIVIERQETLSSALHSRPLGNDQILLAASPALEHIDPSFPAVLPPEGTLWHQICAGICLQEQLHPAAVFQTENLAATAALLLTMPLAAFLPGQFLRQQGEKENGLREIPLSRSYSFRISFLTLPEPSAFPEILEGLYPILFNHFSSEFS